MSVREEREANAKALAEGFTQDQLDVLEALYAAEDKAHNEGLKYPAGSAERFALWDRAWEFCGTAKDLVRSIRRDLDQNKEPA